MESLRKRRNDLRRQQKKQMGIPQEVILYENNYREVMFLNENMHEAEPVPIESDPIQEEQADLQSMFSDAACANVPDDEVDSPDSS